MPVRGPIARPQVQLRRVAKVFRSRTFRTWMALSFLCVFLVLSAISGLALLAVWKHFHKLDIGFIPSADKPLRIYDRYDQLVCSLYGERDLQPVALKKISPNLPHAVVAAEDHDFYIHDGIDILGICRAILKNIQAGHAVQGGSTISQQLAKNLYFEGEKRSLSHKLQESVIAVEMESRYSKEQIMEAYLNYVYFGNGVYGAERASEYYFGKKPSQLNIAEAAYLAALVNAPSRLSNPKNKAQAIARQQFILDSMEKLGYATGAQVRIAKKQKLAFRSAANSSRKYPSYVKEVLEQMKQQFGPDLFDKGLSVYTSLDQVAQALAEAQLSQGIRQAPVGINEGALVSISVPDGAIIAMVGGVNQSKNEWNRALHPHTAGSAFKPFVYLTGLQQGVLQPESLLQDEPIEIPMAGSAPYRPKNYDNSFMGSMTIRKAIALSRNIPAVRVAQQVGPDNVVKTAQLAGIKSKLDANLSLALGSSAVSPLDMATAYATLAKGGVYVQPYLVRKVVDAKGKVLAETHQETRKVFETEPVAQLIDALQDVVERGTGTRARLFDRPVAGKTGTSDSAKDIWFIGFTPDTVTAVWGGNDLNKPVPGHATGGTVMAGIWQRYMQAYYHRRNVPVGSFPHPQNPLIDEVEPIYIMPTPARIFDRFLGEMLPQGVVREYHWGDQNPGPQPDNQQFEQRHDDDDEDDDRPKKKKKKKKGFFKRIWNWIEEEL